VSAAPLGPTERAALLGVARAALRHHLGLGDAPVLPDRGGLGERRGAFVTLRVRGRLRGCVGTFTPEGSLALTVARMAVAAASQDPRFEPLRAEELDEIELHVSALGPLRPMADPSQISIGRDGIAVRRGWHRGTLLPAVAVENGWDARAFLQRTCLKAGLPPDAWSAPDAAVELFSAEEFGDPDPDGEGDPGPDA
jgi:AmmeMemoRadiSam system protein A